MENSEVRFGPAGLGQVKDAIKNLEEYHRLGFRACEIAFTYGAYIKNKDDAEKIGKKAKELGIRLSIHAHYWINLNSEEPEKIEQSKERILECLKVGTWLGAEVVVFHPGFYGKMSREETYQNIEKQMKELETERKKNNFTTKLAPETTGKINVFGSVDEILSLVKETGCSFCIDFAHILAREKKYLFEKVFKKFSDYSDFHIHFSGINYGEKGEKNHIKTPENGLKELIENLPKNAKVTIINESPEMIEDSAEALKIYQNHRR
ncbi:TIM barrel protein [Candidatus Pacearchaeota archaeon]|nr:TIM barrel protein [Candidatus Pacearchaeota archaeon]